MLPEQIPGVSQTEPAIGLAAPASPITTSDKVLRTKEDIADLYQRSRQLFYPLGVRKVRIAVDGLSDPIASEVETRLNDALHECGCQTGSVAAALSVVVYLALLGVAVGWPSSWSWKHLFMGIAFCFSMALIGKLFGLLRARVKLVRGLELLWRTCQGRETTSSGRINHGPLV